MTSIAAIVCGHTLDRWGDIQQAISSLQAQTRPADQIIFSVDNNAELFHAASEAFPAVTVVHNEGARGVSPARNTAARATTCEVLAYLDDDATADTQWIERLVSWYDDANVTGVGGTANPAWDGDGTGPSWFPPSFNWVVGCSHSGIGATPAPVRNFIGCNMSIRRSAWEAVGGFDDSLGRVGADGAGGDETDFCIRVTETVGGTIMNDPAAIVAHRVPQSRQTLGYFLKRCRSEGRSKAQISARAGADRALAEERKHLLGELPKSFVAGFADAIRGDVAGISRSAAIVVGTGATGFGYIVGALKSRSHDKSEAHDADFEPIAVVTVDLLVQDDDPSAATSRPAFVIARRGAKLLGTHRFKKLPAPAELRSFLSDAHRERQEPAPADTPPLDRTIAVVIATRDRPASLGRCLESLDLMVRRPDQIIVVDNAPSTDETQKMMDGWTSSSGIEAIYVHCREPGLARAHNAALPHVTSDIVAFTDDDVLVDKYWLQELLVGFVTDEQVVCVTGAIMPAEIETWAQAWVEETSNFTKGFQATTFSAAAPPADPIFPFTAGSMGSGANMAFSTNWLRTNSGFNEALGAGTTALGGDDLRAFYDVVVSGNAVHFTPDAVVFHHHHRTAEAIERQTYGYGSGLTAFLTSVAIDEPATLVRMAKQARSGLRRAGEITSQPVASFPGDAHRSRRQRRGMLSGPFRYLRSLA